MDVSSLLVALLRRRKRHQKQDHLDRRRESE